MTSDTENWQTLVKEKEYNDLLIEWNKKINLVSRKKPDVFDLINDSKLFFEYINFKEGTRILDLGTGGGLPGIVIAIHHPEAKLTLVDSIQKKINVVSDIIKKLGLKNVEAIWSRAEDLIKSPFEKGETGGFDNYFDYIVSRSAAVLQDLTKWSKDLLKPGGKLITVKGGNIAGEIHKTKKLDFVKNIEVFEVNDRKVVIVTSTL